LANFFGKKIRKKNNANSRKNVNNNKFEIIDLKEKRLLVMNKNLKT